MLPAAIIEKKRDGGKLSAAEISYFVQGFTSGDIPDYQAAAWAMAVYFSGMDAEETAELTREMLHSGGMLRRRPGGPPRVDKHSTGGVGDKTSLILAPLLACCGLHVPMISGRGLGPTGGTLDKLESIPGFRTDLSAAEIDGVLDEVGCVITGQTADLVPADKKLYALRDVTGTVPSKPLITASILSKKLAEDLDALVLDVKWGSGTFMKTREEAQQLADLLQSTGTALGLNTSCMLSDMNQPLGRMAGNAVEVLEALDVLSGGGPDDVRELVLLLGARLLIQVGNTSSEDDARHTLVGHLQSGHARQRFERMVAAQGGDLQKPLAVAPAHEILASRGGRIASIDTAKLGQAITALGGGRRIAGEAIDPSVGLEILVRVGEKVEAGYTILRLFAQAAGRNDAESLVREAVSLDEE